MFSVKQKRSFHTVLSGLKFSKYGKKDIRFMTLTTSLLCKESIGYDDGSLNNHFQSLRKRICRYSPYRLYQEGYISKNQMTRKYGHEDIFKPFNFDYFKVTTNEGNGVLHILYRGSYLPYNFIVDNWQDIHISWHINIMKVNLNDCKNASCYIVSQYVGGQDCSYVRSSQSWKWLFRGFKSAWYDVRQGVYNRCYHNPVVNKWYINHIEVNPLQLALNQWDNGLKLRAIYSFFPQSSLTDFG